MIFLGQKSIMRQLDRYLPKIYEDPNLNMTFLLRAPSGWGKTRMAFMMCNYLTGGNFEYYLGDKVPRVFSKRVVFIDEVHLLKEPEFLYPIIDSEKHTIILATNEVAVLLEALSNRCTQLVFEPYTIAELQEIADTSLKIRLPESHLNYLIESSGNNPRVLKGLCSKINITGYDVSRTSIEQFKSFLRDLFGIKDGMDELCNRYMEVLRNLGGTASIQTLANQLRIDQGSIKFYIEPILIFKNLIQITSKGRTIL